MKLHLGVIPVSYANTNDVTTVDVANRLEKTYSIFEMFFKKYESEIRTIIVDQISKLIYETQLRKFEFNLLELDRIKELFSQFLIREEIVGMGIPGTPTKRALAGISLRLKNKKGSRRPSFMDTWLYHNSMRAWVSLDD